MEARLKVDVLEEAKRCVNFFIKYPEHFDFYFICIDNHVLDVSKKDELQNLLFDALLLTSKCIDGFKKAVFVVKASQYCTWMLGNDIGTQTRSWLATSFLMAR